MGARCRMRYVCMSTLWHFLSSDTERLHLRLTMDCNPVVKLLISGQLYGLLHIQPRVQRGLHIEVARLLETCLRALRLTYLRLLVKVMSQRALIPLLLRSERLSLGWRHLHSRGSNVGWCVSTHPLPAERAHVSRADLVLITRTR